MTDYLTNTIDASSLSAIANQFSHSARVVQVEPLGSGIINDTFFVMTDSPTQSDFVLQRVNTQVFRQPQLVMQNMCILTEHICRILDNSQLERRWEIPRVLLTNTNQNHYLDAEKSFWRAISFIPDSYSFDIIKNHHQAQEIGYALGCFHNLISDLSPSKLADTLPGFHITPTYLEVYQQVLANSSLPNSQILTSEEKYCLQFISDRQSWVSILEDAKYQGLLPLRLMHGDPKINNVLFDNQTHQSVSVIDLDTVKPGLIHYDIGDCLRSGCNLNGEETENWENVTFDVDICQGIITGYLSSAKAFLTHHDYLYIYDAIRLITFELGLRFFTDYLTGNVYFKVKYPEHNLARALVQFQLTHSIEEQESTIRKIIKSAQ